MELLKGENFMSADYKNIALQNGTNLNVLREIYLCACDKISVKDVQEVIDNRKTDIAGYLRKIRYQKACGVIIGKGNNTLKELHQAVNYLVIFHFYHLSFRYRNPAPLKAHEMFSICLAPLIFLFGVISAVFLFLLFLPCHFLD